MKKIVSTQGLLFGQFDDTNISCAINERVNPKLETFYNQNSRNGDIHIESKLSYTLFDGQVTSLLLIYTIDNPTTQRLEYFRDTCDDFYDLFGFMIDNESSTPHVFLKATDIYDMASLIHALAYHTISLESVMCAIDANLTEKDAIYSPSGVHLLQLPDIPRYRIKEGTLFICPGATRHCKRLRELDVPKDLVNPYEALSDYPYPLKVKVWETYYDGTTDEDDDDSYDEPYKVDDYGVNYSHDGKILKSCRLSFNETHYEVPDGVEEIDFGAFGICRHFLELSIPRTVKIIGDSIFGNNGGVIMIRDEYPHTENKCQLEVR